MNIKDDLEYLGRLFQLPFKYDDETDTYFVGGVGLTPPQTSENKTDLWEVGFEWHTIGTYESPPDGGYEVFANVASYKLAIEKVLTKLKWDLEARIQDFLMSLDYRKET